MKTFIEQKAEVKQQIVELEGENRQLQHQVEDAEEAIDENLKRINELYEMLKLIGVPECSK